MPFELELLEARRLMVSDPGLIDADTFYYASESLSQQAIISLQARELDFSEHSSWWRPRENNWLTIDESGILVAERQPLDESTHSMLVAEVNGSECFGADGRYTLPNKHYSISFDVRHPPSAASWLSTHPWAVVMQMWGPREHEEIPRNPPFSIYTTSINGEVSWRVATRADSRPISTTRDYEDETIVSIPYKNLGRWQHWDVEYVASPTGGGLVRAWLDGDLVVDLPNIKTGFQSILANAPSGPMNPAIGLYSPPFEQKMEVHFDNVHVRCDGEFARGLAGRVPNHIQIDKVVARNVSTGATYETIPSSAGIYALNVAPGIYHVTASNHSRSTTSLVDLRETSRILDLEPVPTTLIGDVDGDGDDDAIHPNNSGIWFVSTSIHQRVAEPWVFAPATLDFQEAKVADFTGDGRDDVIVLSRSSEWWLLQSHGDRFELESLAEWNLPSRYQALHVGDFDGDEAADLIWMDHNFDWFMGRFVQAQPSTRLWDRWNPARWTDVRVGDFNGDGRDDVMAFDQGTDKVWVTVSSGTGLRRTEWVRLPGQALPHILVADVNGDGMSDLLAHAASDSQWWALESTGTDFVLKSWSEWDQDERWLDVTVADLNADGRDDVVARASSTDRYWATLSTGQSGPNRHLMWLPSTRLGSSWETVRVGDFNGDGRADILSIEPNSESRRRSPFRYAYAFG